MKDMETVNTHVPLARRPAEQEGMARPDQVEIVCYEEGIPPSAAAAIDDVYAHLYCSPRYFEAARALSGASLYVARKGGVPIAALGYQRSGSELTVVSEYMTLDQAEIERFAGHMFSRYRSVTRIAFPRVHAPIKALAYPWHAMVCSEDMVVPLPATVKEYEAAIGKNTRRNIKRYASALTKAFPSYRYDLYLEDAISEQDLRDIVALSCLRMKSKNIVSRFDETEIRWIVEFAKTNGIVGVARIDGEVAAGAIGFRIGDNYFMHVIAHHPRYNAYSLGILCYYHTICEGIARGGKRFHLLNGRYGYKYRLLAERFDVVDLDVYRGRASALAHLRHIATKEARGRIWLFKQWLLHDVDRMDGRGYRLLGKAVNFLRRTKRSKGAADGEM